MRTVIMSLLTAFGIVAIYQSLLLFYPNAPLLDQGRRYGNLLVAQNFLYEPSDKTVVIVGSSLARRLDGSILGSTYYNLALTGGGPLTGLDIITQANKNPSIVVIEINFIHRQKDADILSDLFGVVNFRLRRHLSIFREENRPANYLASAFYSVGEATSQKALGYFQTKSESNNKIRPSFDRARYKELIGIMQRTYDEKPEGALLNERLDSLEKYIKTLQARGIKCVLMEMPIDNSLRTGNLANSIRSAVVKRFPTSRYDWIPEYEFSTSQEPTTDGIHLTEVESHRYSQFVKRQLNQFQNENKKGGD